MTLGLAEVNNSQVAITSKFLKNKIGLATVLLWRPGYLR